MRQLPCTGRRCRLMALGPQRQLHPRDELHLRQPLPRQAQHQGVELRLRQRHRRGMGSHLSRPHEAPGVQSPRGTPHAEAVVHQQLDARGPCVGEQVAVVRLGAAEDLHDAGQKPISAGTHVHGPGGKPQRIDAGPRSNSRIHVAQSADAEVGQVICIVVAPRRNSMRMSGGAAATACDGIASAMNVPAPSWVSARAAGRAVAASVTRRHLCTRLAFNPCVIATLATDASGCRHSVSTRVFSSALCGRRDARLASSMVST